jgi:hypothetical protein
MFETIVPSNEPTFFFKYNAALLRRAGLSYTDAIGRIG